MFNSNYQSEHYTATEDDLPTGGLVRSTLPGGMSRYSEPPLTVTGYVQRINPNLTVGILGVCAIVGVCGWAIGAVFNASPTNQLADSTKVAMESQKAASEAIKAMASQRPANSCWGLCINTQPPQVVQPSPVPAQQPYQNPFAHADAGSTVDPYLQQQPQVTPQQIPGDQLQQQQTNPLQQVQSQVQGQLDQWQQQQQATDPKTPEFWYAQMGDSQYINQWSQFCSPNWNVSPECRALYTAMKTNI